MTASADTLLAEELKHFFARFETVMLHTVTLPPLSTSTHMLALQERQVRHDEDPKSKKTSRTGWSTW